MKFLFLWAHCRRCPYTHGVASMSAGTAVNAEYSVSGSGRSLEPVSCSKSRWRRTRSNGSRNRVSASETGDDYNTQTRSGGRRS